MLDRSGQLSQEAIASLEHADFRLQQFPTRLSRPEPGRSLGGTVTRIEGPIREAVQHLSATKSAKTQVFRGIFNCTTYGPHCAREPDNLRAAWFVVLVTLIHAYATERKMTDSFLKAAEWFFADGSLAKELLHGFEFDQVRRAERALSELSVSHALIDLLPYVVEPLGHVTRSNLSNSADAKIKRKAKKQSGVYYTPSDVADYMVQCAAASNKSHGLWLDPACGTGVFLRAILRNFVGSSQSPISGRLDLIQRHIFAIDKSALATDLASFVLLSDCIHDLLPASPFVAWQQIKKKIVCMDALRLLPKNEKKELYGSRDFAELEEIFPDVGRSGFDHVVMNPPYAKVPIDEGLSRAWQSFAEGGSGRSADAQLAFSEMLWRFTSSKSRSVAVLPLSIGSNTTRSYARLRNDLLNSAGRKDFLFFDREPQSLFGEDIKTRSLILIRDDFKSSKRLVRTSRLLKWTGDQRPTIFGRQCQVDIDADYCERFVPKIGTQAEAVAYFSLKATQKMAQAPVKLPQFGRSTLDNAIEWDAATTARTLLVSGTAYNFINCFFADALPKRPPYLYSASPVNSLSFSTENEAFAAFAVLSSRICFWLWHIEGDGFHLSSEFLRTSPLWGALSEPDSLHSLSVYGRRLWKFACQRMQGSVNGGRQTYSFNSSKDDATRLEIEQVLCRALSLDEEFPGQLDEFIDAVVSINGKCRIRF